MDLHNAVSITFMEVSIWISHQQRQLETNPTGNYTFKVISEDTILLLCLKVTKRYKKNCHLYPSSVF